MTWFWGSIEKKCHFLTTLWLYAKITLPRHWRRRRSKFCDSVFFTGHMQNDSLTDDKSCMRMMFRTSMQKKEKSATSRKLLHLFFFNGKNTFCIECSFSRWQWWCAKFLCRYLVHCKQCKGQNKHTSDKKWHEIL